MDESISSRKILQYVYQVFLKKNVRYPVWTCRDPISLNLGTRFSILGTRIRSLKHLKNPCVYISSTILDYGLSVSCFCLGGPFNIFS